MHGAGVEHRDRELVAIEALQQRQHEEIHRVLAVEVAGDQADAQGAIGIAVVGEGAGGGERLLDSGAELAVLGGDLLGAAVIDVEGGHGDGRGQA